LALGDVREQSLADMLASPAYLRSLARDAAERNKFCHDCEFAGPCTGWHIFEARQTGDYQRRCPIAYPVIQHVQNRLIEYGYDQRHLLHMTDEVLREHSFNGKSDYRNNPLARCQHLTNEGSHLKARPSELVDTTRIAP
jgi:hypothetical protein